DLRGILDLQSLCFLHRIDNHDPAGGLAERADHLIVVRVAHEDDGATLLRVTNGLEVDLCDEGAGRVDHPEVSDRRSFTNGRGYAVSAEDACRPLGYLVELVHEDRALLPECLDHVPVVDDLAPYVDRHTHDLEGPLDDLDRPLDARAKASRARQDD